MRYITLQTSNINEVIRPVLNFFFFIARFYTLKKNKKNTRDQKVTKDTKRSKKQPSKSTKTQISE